MFKPIYRGKRAYGTGEWIVGGPIWDDEEGVILGIASKDAHPTDQPVIGDEWIDGRFIACRKETIGAYTGVNDNYGARIFEDDVLTMQLDIGVYSGFDFGRVRVEFRRGSFMLVDRIGRAVAALSGINSNIVLKIIGNIHDSSGNMEG